MEVKNLQTDIIILISSRLIEFWCFGLPVALGGGVGLDGGGVVGGWEWGLGGWGWLGDAPFTCAHACTHTHGHACTCMHGKHDNFMQMAAPLDFWGFPGNSL